MSKRSFLARSFTVVRNGKIILFGQMGLLGMYHQFQRPKQITWLEAHDCRKNKSLCE